MIERTTNQPVRVPTIADLIETDTKVYEVAALIELVASEQREALPLVLELLEQHPATLTTYRHLVAACEASLPPGSLEPAPVEELTEAATDLDSLETCPPQDAPQALRTYPNPDALLAVARLRAARLKVARGQAPPVGRRCVLEGIIATLSPAA